MREFHPKIKQQLSEKSKWKQKNKEEKYQNAKDFSAIRWTELE